METKTEEKNNALEGIRGALPLAADLDADLDGLVDVLCAALVVDAELEDVAVFEGVWAAGVGRGVAT
jgi:hypothetical protein